MSVGPLEGRPLGEEDGLLLGKWLGSALGALEGEEDEALLGPKLG